jgi:hypothetical protein
MWRRIRSAGIGISLHERPESLVSYFCMSVDVAGAGCALAEARRLRMPRSGHIAL